MLLALVLSAKAQTPKHEVRAVWLTTIGGIDWPHSYSTATQKAELISILDQLQQAGINTVLIQTRVRATTIFPTTTEPWDGCLTADVYRRVSSPRYGVPCVDCYNPRWKVERNWLQTVATEIPNSDKEDWR